MSKMRYMRGDIYFVQCTDGYKPAVIVSSHIGNKTSQYVIVCLISNTAKKLSCNVDVAWHTQNHPDGGSQVLCNHIFTITKEGLGRPIGSLSEDELTNVDKALAISLGLKGV